MNDKATPPNSTENRKKPKSKRGGLFIIAIFVIALIFLSRQQAVNTIDCSADILASEPDVIMLGAWWCSYCYKAKKYFQKNQIHYCEYDMENTERGRTLYEDNGGGAIPILLIGKHTLRGFSEHQIDTALTLLDKPASTSER